jgi:putative flippase GtrA
MRAKSHLLKASAMKEFDDMGSAFAGLESVPPMTYGNSADAERVAPAEAQSAQPELEQVAQAPAERRVGLLTRLWKSWATRSLVAGGIATVVDILVGLGVLAVFDSFNEHLPPHRAVSIAAMVGVAVGTMVAFVVNRFFAFKEKNPKVAGPALKFLLATAVAMVIHGQLVAFLKVQYAVPFPIAKMGADLAVFSVGQLLVLRFLVFPKKKT